MVLARSRLRLSGRAQKLTIAPRGTAVSLQESERMPGPAASTTLKALQEELSLGPESFPLLQDLVRIRSRVNQSMRGPRS